MKIICSMDEYYDLNEVITAGCCWIGSGEGGDKKVVDLKKFKMATNFKGRKAPIVWEIAYD